MAIFTVSFTCDNAAFADDPNTEISRILKQVADLVEYHWIIDSDSSRPLRDENGNFIGSAKYIKEG